MKLDETILIEIQDYINELEETVGLNNETIEDIKRAINNYKNKLKNLWLGDVIKSVCVTSPICKIKIDDESCNPADCPYFVSQTVL